jgi:hypothetical protein
MHAIISEFTVYGHSYMVVWFTYTNTICVYHSRNISVLVLPVVMFTSLNFHVLKCQLLGTKCADLYWYPALFCYPGFLHQENRLPLYKWNNFEGGIKHPKSSQINLNIWQ